MIISKMIMDNILVSNILRNFHLSQTFMILIITCKIYGQEANDKSYRRYDATLRNPTKWSNFPRETIPEMKHTGRQFYPKNIDREGTDVNLRQRNLNHPTKNGQNVERTNHMESSQLQWRHSSTQNNDNNLNQEATSMLKNQQNYRISYPRYQHSRESSDLSNLPKFTKQRGPDRRRGQRSRAEATEGTRIGYSEYRNSKYMPHISDSSPSEILPDQNYQQQSEEKQQHTNVHSRTISDRSAYNVPPHALDSNSESTGSNLKNLNNSQFHGNQYLPAMKNLREYESTSLINHEPIARQQNAFTRRTSGPNYPNDKNMHLIGNRQKSDRILGGSESTSGFKNQPIAMRQTSFTGRFPGPNNQLQSSQYSQQGSTDAPSTENVPKMDQEQTISGNGMKEQIQTSQKRASASSQISHRTTEFKGESTGSNEGLLPINSERKNSNTSRLRESTRQFPVNSGRTNSYVPEASQSRQFFVNSGKSISHAGRTGEGTDKTAEQNTGRLSEHVSRPLLDKSRAQSTESSRRSFTNRQTRMDFQGSTKHQKEVSPQMITDQSTRMVQESMGGAANHETLMNGFPSRTNWKLNSNHTARDSRRTQNHAESTEQDKRLTDHRSTNNQRQTKSTKSKIQNHRSSEPYDPVDTWHDHLDTMKDLHQDQLEASMMFGGSRTNIPTMTDPNGGRLTQNGHLISAPSYSAGHLSDHVDTMKDLRQDQMEAHMLYGQRDRSTEQRPNINSQEMTTNGLWEGSNSQQRPNENLRSRPTSSLWEGSNSQKRPNGNVRSRPTTSLWEGINSQQRPNGNARSRSTTSLWEDINSQQRPNENVRTRPTNSLWEGSNSQKRPNGNARSRPTTSLWEGTNSQQSPNGNARSRSTTSLWEGTNSQQRPNGNARSRSTTSLWEGTNSQQRPNGNARSRPTTSLWKGSNSQQRPNGNARSRSTTSLWEGTNSQQRPNGNARSRSTTSLWEGTNSQQRPNGNARSRSTTSLWEGINSQQRPNENTRSRSITSLREGINSQQRPNVNARSRSTTSIWENTDSQQRPNENIQSRPTSVLGESTDNLLTSSENARSRLTSSVWEGTDNQQRPNHNVRSRPTIALWEGTNNQTDMMVNNHKIPTSSVREGSNEQVKQHNGTDVIRKNMSDISIDSGMYTRQRIMNTPKTHSSSMITTDSSWEATDQSRTLGSRTRANQYWQGTNNTHMLGSQTNPAWQERNEGQQLGPRSTNGEISNFHKSESQGQERNEGQPSGSRSTNGEISNFHKTDSQVWNRKGQESTRGDNYDHSSRSSSINGREQRLSMNKYETLISPSTRRDELFNQEGVYPRFGRGPMRTSQGQESTYQGQTSFYNQYRPQEHYRHNMEGTTYNQERERTRGYFDSSINPGQETSQSNKNTNQETKSTKGEQETETEDSTKKSSEIETSTRKYEKEESSTTSKPEQHVSFRHPRPENERSWSRPGQARTHTSPNYHSDRGSQNNYRDYFTDKFRNSENPMTDRTLHESIGNIQRSNFEGISSSSSSHPQREITPNQSVLNTGGNKHTYKPSSRFNIQTAESRIPSIRNSAHESSHVTLPPFDRQNVFNMGSDSRPVSQITHTEHSLSMEVPSSDKNIQMISQQFGNQELTTKPSYVRGRFNSTNVGSKIIYQKTTSVMPNSTDPLLLIEPVSPPSSTTASATFGIIVGIIVGFWIILGPLICLLCKLKDKRKSKKARLRSSADRNIEENGIMEAMVMSELGGGVDPNNSKNTLNGHVTKNKFNGDYAKYTHNTDETKHLKSHSESEIHHAIVH